MGTASSIFSPLGFLDFPTSRQRAKLAKDQCIRHRTHHFTDCGPTRSESPGAGNWSEKKMAYLSKIGVTFYRAMSITWISKVASSEPGSGRQSIILVSYNGAINSHSRNANHGTQWKAVDLEHAAGTNSPELVNDRNINCDSHRVVKLPPTNSTPECSS
ncbi:unnamed protein product [Nezara viridula]|uniref:Uncharacterized protein n=1 Tax=Nezara viridula TaxID=85310 RepID=A0A9P0E2G9_NEZVI|nr:unnamed protein product [Nezara viridula]